MQQQFVSRFLTSYVDKEHNLQLFLHYADSVCSDFCSLWQFFQDRNHNITIHLVEY